MEIIGEAATQVSADGKAAVAELPRAQITGVRNRLIHGYSDVNFKTEWLTAMNRLPELAAILAAVP